MGDPLGLWCPAEVRSGPGVQPRGVLGEGRSCRGCEASVAPGAGRQGLPGREPLAEPSVSPARKQDVPRFLFAQPRQLAELTL